MELNGGISGATQFMSTACKLSNARINARTTHFTSWTAVLATFRHLEYFIKRKCAEPVIGSSVMFCQYKFSLGLNSYPSSPLCNGPQTKSPDLYFSLTLTKSKLTN